MRALKFIDNMPKRYQAAEIFRRNVRRIFVVLEIPSLLYIISILPSRRAHPSEATTYIDLSSATFKQNTQTRPSRPICVTVSRQSRDFVTLITKFCTSNERHVETFNEVSSVNFRTFRTVARLARRVYTRGSRQSFSLTVEIFKSLSCVHGRIKFGPHVHARKVQSQGWFINRRQWGRVSTFEDKREDT